MLCCAVLCRAVLCCVVLCCAVLWYLCCAVCPVLCTAVLSCAVHCCALQRCYAMQLCNTAVQYSCTTVCCAMLCFAMLCSAACVAMLCGRLLVAADADGFSRRALRRSVKGEAKTNRRARAMTQQSSSVPAPHATNRTLALSVRTVSSSFLGGAKLEPPMQGMYMLIHT